MRPTDGWQRERRLRRAEEEDIAAELALHISGRTQAYVSKGMSEPDARRRAEADFGDVRAIARACRSDRRRGQPRNFIAMGRESMQAILKDTSHALRALIRRPGYSLAVILTLVLGIGATTAVFSVVNGVLLQPLPHPNAEQLVLIWEVDGRPGFFDDRNVVAPANFKDWRDHNRVFSNVAAFQRFPTTIRLGETPEQVDRGNASRGFFETLGVNAHIGRTFLDEEDAAGADDVVLLGYDFWRTRFNADSSVLGTTIGVGRSGASTPTVVGVLPEDFRFLDQQPSLWLPLGLQESQYESRQSHYLNVVARMNPGVSLEDAQRDMDRVVAGLRDAYPEFLAGWGVNVLSMNEQIVGQIRPALVVLLGAVGLVLLIAAVNVANLMLTRTMGETRELAIRTALGAGKGRLVRHKLIESLLLATVGGALGIVAAVGVTTALIAMAPDNLPRSDSIGINVWVLTFAMAVTLLTGLLVGLVPAFQASRINLASGLKETSHQHTDSRAQVRIRSAFVIAQLAFSTMLLVSAGLMLGTFASLMRVDPGFESGGVATMTVTLTGEEYADRAAQIQLYDRLLPELERLPEVQLASAAKFLPLQGGAWTWSVQVQGKPERREGEKRDYGYHAVSRDYFRAMGITLVRGRGFDAFDRHGSQLAMVVNEAFVRRFFDAGEDPIGHRVYVISRPDEVFQIVGIIEDVRYLSLDTDPSPAYYVHHAQIPFDFFLTEMTIALRTSGDPAAVGRPARRIIHSVDRNIMITNETTMTDRVARSVARTRFAMSLLVVFAVTALSLAVIGIYGVIAYSTGQRGQEIGVRVALGAEPKRIIGQFMGTGGKLIGLGLTVGLVGAAVLTRFQESLLHGVKAVDPATYAAVAGVLASAAFIAVYIPSRRASRVDPVRVLRGE